ncbi:hypothetical protein HDE_08667 [Halotydeus destructor]|nr:hypothetical protein HDE_08667 [Halotydeus destructor]
MSDESYPAPSPYKPLARAQQPPPDGVWWVTLRVTEDAALEVRLLDREEDRALHQPRRRAQANQVASFRASEAFRPSPPVPRFGPGVPRKPAPKEATPARSAPKVRPRDRQVLLVRRTLEMSDEDE